LAPRYAKGSDPVLIELASVHLAQHRMLSGRLTELDARREAGEPVSSAPLLRTLRQEAALIRGLLAGLKPIEPEAASDPWSEFDHTINPLAEFLKP